MTDNALERIEDHLRTAGHSGLTVSECYDLTPDISKTRVKTAFDRLEARRVAWKWALPEGGNRNEPRFRYCHRSCAVVHGWQRW